MAIYRRVNMCLALLSVIYLHSFIRCSQKPDEICTVILISPNEYLTQNQTTSMWQRQPWIQAAWLHCASWTGQPEHSGGWERLRYIHMSAVWPVSCILGPAQFAETYHGSTWTVWVSHQVTPVHISAHDHALLSPPAPLVDLTPTHSGSAMLMLLSVVFVGLAVFVIYKFKRYVSLHPCLLSLFLLHDRFRSMHRSDVRLPCIAVMVSVNVLGRSRGLMFMPRCRMRKNERWSVKSVTLKTGPISLRLN